MEGSRLRVTLVILMLVVLVLGLLVLAFVSQSRERAASTAKPPAFQNPFTQQPQNPFATESGYQNPFETTKSGSQEYRNPFENLR